MAHYAYIALKFCKTFWKYEIKQVRITFMISKAKIILVGENVEIFTVEWDFIKDTVCQRDAFQSQPRNAPILCLRGMLETK